MRVWQAIKFWSEKTPDRSALTLLNNRSVSYSELKRLITLAFTNLPDIQGKRVGVFVRNNLTWVVYDIALTLKGALIVPLPSFFSEGQLRHIVSDTVLDFIVADTIGSLEHEKISALFYKEKILRASISENHCPEQLESCFIEGLSNERIVKITYTSGTTGTPKGVMISLRGIESVVDSLLERTGASHTDEYLSILPLSTLLENIGGVYVPLVAGAGITFLCNNDKTKDGISPDHELFLRVLEHAEPSSMIIVPQFIELLIYYTTRKADSSHFRFIACGGSSVPTSLLNESISKGLPLFEGYGLSECTSVVSVNGIGSNRPGSVGKPLRHTSITTDDSEIIVSGVGVMAGYLHEQARNIGTWHTGDLGYTDDDGYLYVTGRKDSLFSTALGRTISPEWIERELTSSSFIGQIMVWGEKKPFVSAVVVPDRAWLSEEAGRLKLGKDEGAIARNQRIKNLVIEEINSKIGNLPEYARIGDVIITDQSFTCSNGMMTADGRLRREAIYHKYIGEFDRLYE